MGKMEGRPLVLPVPWQGVRAQGLLCSWDDVGSPQAAGPGPGWLAATPWKAEIPARMRHRAAGKQPCTRVRANKGLRAWLDTKVMGTSPGEQWGWHSPAVETGQQQLSSMEVSWGGQRGEM